MTLSTIFQLYRGPEWRVGSKIAYMKNSNWSVFSLNFDFWVIFSKIFCVKKKRKTTEGPLRFLLFTWTESHKTYLDFMVLNATFNNISDISWRSVLLVEETRVSWENHRPGTSNWRTLSHNVVSPEWDSTSKLAVMIVIDCIGSCKSNYHTITITTDPILIWHNYLKWSLI